MVKAPHAQVSFERAFFLASSPEEYRATSKRLIDAGVLTADGLAAARIEEYALGPSVNLNFFYSPLLGELELSGTDTRRQTNLEGFRNVPPSAFEAVRDVPMRLEEAGHIAATVTESMLEPAFEMGERFVEAARQARPPGVIGPFALQCVIVRGAAEGARLLRRLAAHPGLARHALHAVFGLPLGPRRLGRRAHRDGDRDGARHRSPRGCVDLAYCKTADRRYSMTVDGVQARTGVMTFKGKPVTLRRARAARGRPGARVYADGGRSLDRNARDLADEGKNAVDADRRSVARHDASARSSRKSSTRASASCRDSVRVSS